jgi:hypothetical protein
VAESGTPTNGIRVLDIVWMLPAMILTAVWMWHERAPGYTLAGALLTFMSALVLAIMAMMVSMGSPGSRRRHGPHTRRGSGRYPRRPTHETAQAPTAGAREDRGGNLYGVCDATGERIARDRLRAVPEAVYTIDAQRTLERDT